MPSSLGSSSGSGSNNGSGSSNGSSGNPGSGGTSVASGSGGSGSGGFVSSSLASSGPQDAGMGCVPQQVPLSTIPVDMVVMMDQSGSMVDITPGGLSKWDATKAALQAFVQTPPASLRVGLQFHALQQTGIMCPASCVNDADCESCGPCLFNICVGFAGQDSCNPDDYETPEAAVLPVPGNAVAITTSLNTHSPSTGSAPSGALEGAINHGLTLAQQNPDHAVVDVLVVDGEPGECITDAAALAQVASTGTNATHAVHSHVLAIMETPAFWAPVATAGDGLLLPAAPSLNVAANTLAAFQRVVTRERACAHLLPTGDAGTVNPQALEVTLQNQAVPWVPGRIFCNGAGWYLAGVKTLRLCPLSCDAAESSGESPLVTVPCP